jgi:LmbE family N-acetylglucosaminyl deacetylase
MDDEVLGCGGTLARHARAGASITVAFLTDGRHKVDSDVNATGAAREKLERELMDARAREALEAAAILGVGDVRFFGAAAGRLSSSDAISDQVHSLLAALTPSIIYLPFFTDRHPDHRAVSRILLDAAPANDSFECRGYEVWAPLPANLLVSIDPSLDAKLKALACYRSQLAHTDFVHIGIGLNAYRASGVGTGCRHAEAFCALPHAEYRDLHENWIRSNRE